MRNVGRKKAGEKDEAKINFYSDSNVHEHQIKDTIKSIPAICILASSSSSPFIFRHFPRPM